MPEYYPPETARARSADGTWQDGNVCIGCGEDNPIGLHLAFDWEGDWMVAAFTPRPEHQGWKGYAHGGILSLVLDEAMAQSVNRSGHIVPTAGMQVRFRRPAPVGRPLTVRATRPEGRRVLTVRAELRDAEGALIAEATGRFLAGTGVKMEQQR